MFRHNYLIANLRKNLLNRPVLILITFIFFILIFPIGYAFAGSGSITSITNTGGILSINGSATGTGYHLEYNVGTNPSTWIKIGDYTGSKSGELGTWDTRRIGNGTYTVQLRVDDTVAPTLYTTTTTFTVQNPNPVITNKFPQDGATGSPSDLTISAVFNKDMKDTSITDSTFYLMDANNNLTTGTVSYDSTNKMANLAVAGLATSKTYYVYLTSGVTDTLGYKLDPVIWAFTTKGATTTRDPHGGFTNNANTCASCHGMHNSPEGNLLNLQSTDGNNTTVNIEMYCNSCHDGTVAAPADSHDAPPAENYTGKTNKHSFAISDNVPQELSCNACHDPHLPPSTKDNTSNTIDNFNLIQNYYSYDHSTSTPFDASIPNSSEKELCENCHAPLSNQSDPNYPKGVPGIYSNAASSFNLYKYNRKMESQGTADDYSLCFRCHEQNGLVQSGNIQEYYGGDTNGDYTVTTTNTTTTYTSTGHYIKSAGATKPQGWKMSCSDCHNEHGSNNQRLIKESLGDENPTTISIPGLPKTALSYSQQRTVCTGCHNNRTEMYGIVITLPDGVDGHQASDTRYCTACHGTNNPTDSALQGAHAPN